MGIPIRIGKLRYALTTHYQTKHAGRARNFNKEAVKLLEGCAVTKIQKIVPYLSPPRSNARPMNCAPAGSHSPAYLLPTSQTEKR